MAQQIARAAGLEGWIGALLLAIVGGLVGTVPSSAPKSQRPVTPPAGESVVASTDGALVRSWEDPLGAARAAIVGSKGAGRERWNWNGELSIRGPEIPGNVSVLAVEMGDSPTAEGEEERMRTRQAAIAALHRLGYAPVARWRRRVDYVEVGGEDARPVTLGSIMAYEWWEPDPTRAERAGFNDQCLVLWLGSRVIRDEDGSPLRSLEELVSKLRRANDIVRVVQLRGNSDNLRTSVLEWAKRHGEDKGNKMMVASINATSTADSRLLFPNVQQGTVLAKWIDVQAGDGVKVAPGCVNRVLGSDWQLLERMVMELELRGIRPQNGRDVVVVVHERDSAWGRAWPETLRRVIGDTTDADIRTIGFLRTVDGDTLSVPRARSDDRSAGGTAATGSSAPDMASAVASAGQSQLDYVFRMLRQTQRDLNRSREGRLRAVFVGASDPWDVRPLVQMIRRNFPDVLVLTTDLYGQHEDVANSEVMRNLVVVSHLGLSCHSVLQRDIPAFRSSYQTAQFIGVLRGMSLGRVDEAAAVLAGKGNEAKRPAIRGVLTGEVMPGGRTYEVSTDGAVDLSIAGPAEPPRDWIYYHEAAGPPVLGFASMPAGRIVLLLVLAGGIGLSVLASRIRLDDPGRVSTLRCYALLGFPLALAGLLWATGTLHEASHIVGYLLVVLSIAGVGLFVVWTWRFGEGAWYSEVSRRSLPWRSFHRWGFMGIGVLWALVAACIAMIAAGSGPDGEPFSWGNGISVWVPEIVHVVTIALAVVFLCRYAIATRWRHTGRTWGREFFSREAWSSGWKNFGVIDWEPPCRKGSNGEVRVAKLQLQLEARLRPAAVALRILLLAVPFGVGVVAVYILADSSAHGVRGVVARAIDTTLTTMVVVLVNVVVFVVWDAARVHTRYISNLASGRSRWPARKIREAGREYGVDQSLVGYLLDVQDIAQRTAVVNSLIYWPVALILLSVLSYHPRFDRWPSDLSSLGLFGVSLSIAVYAGYMLRRAAERARGIEIERLQHVVARPDVHPDAERLSSRELVIEFKLPVRPGGRGNPKEFFAVGYAEGVPVPLNPHAMRRLGESWANGANVEDVDLSDLERGPTGGLLCTTTRAREVQGVVIRAFSMAHGEELSQWAARRARQAERLIDQMKGMREGAFAAWQDDPLFRAIALPLLGFAGVQGASWIASILQR
ncbi:MAG: hypothetical protein KF745_05395 [Phycisphaeraceae bacterium]|nr:hypothetical protein [Phycisphaeraceae bacterium]